MTTVNAAQEEAYAENTLKGFWDKKNLELFDDSGFRATGSVYDPVNESIYVVSSPGHLYKIDESSNIKWSLRNNKKNLNGEDLNGVNLANGNFRLLHQKANGAMEFSDDEGRTWIDANGAYFQNSWNFKTLVAKKNQGRRIVAFGGRYANPNNIGYYRVYISDDYGLNYRISQSTSHLTISGFDVKLCKPHNSNTIYCFARRRSDSKIFMYRMKTGDTDLVYVGQPVTLGGLESVVGTMLDGKTHFYISYDNKFIFYSNNDGATWAEVSSNNSERNILEIHPTKPNVCFKGFVDLYVSIDYGATWSTNRHNIGPNNSYYVWDLQHMKIYDKENGGNFTFAGFDFGSFYSTNPEDSNSWVSINKGNPTMMSYDAATSEKHNKIYSANQDRGAQSFIEDKDTNNSHLSPALREANTDVLRVAISNNGESSWFWYYYGSIGRASVTNGGDYRTVVKKSLYTYWAATSMIPSPDKNEDAIYIPWGNKLNKISYTNGQVTRTYHPYAFPEAAHSFGYSNLNTKRWYAGLKSGIFMYSIDGGNSFKKSDYTGTWPISEDSARKRRSVIATSPVDEATVYYAGKGNIFLMSTDGGITFTNHNNGLNVDRIVDMQASRDGKFIFAACEFDGAWVFSLEKDKWYKMNGNAVPAVIGFTDVQFINSNDTARFATYGCGILDFKIEEGLTKLPEDGYYQLQQRASNKCMNVSEWGGNNAPLIQWDCVEQDNSKFYLEKQNDGSYEIRAAYNNKAISVPREINNGSLVNIYDDIDQNNQRYILTNRGNGYYSISPINSPGKSLAISGQNVNEQGGPVIVWNYYNQTNYHWLFKATTVTDETLSNNSIINSKQDIAINIFPTPVVNNFTITLGNINKPSITICNMLGKIIYKEQNIKNNSIKLTKNKDFTTGVYIVKITDASRKTYTKKFTVN